VKFECFLLLLLFHTSSGLLLFGEYFHVHVFTFTHFYCIFYEQIEWMDGWMWSTETGTGGGVTYDLITIAAVNSSNSLIDGSTVTQLNFWIHAVLIKIIPCLLLTLFGCLLVSTVRESQRHALKLSAGSRLGPHMSKAGKRRLAERNRTTV